MKYFCSLVLWVILASPAAQAAPARTYNSSQIGNARGGASENLDNWFYQVQPLSATPQALKAPTVAEHQKAATAPPKAAPLAKDVRAIPPPRPKRKTDKDTRKVDVTKDAQDKRKVLDIPVVAKKAEVRAPVSRPAYDISIFDKADKDPNFHAQSRAIDGAFAPVPKPKKRNHGLADWP